MKIVIDARIMFTTTGRYVERLVHYLQAIDDVNDYVVLLEPKDIDKWQPSAPNFSKLPAPFAQYSLSEQIGFARLLYSLKPDLVHFIMPQQPLLYFGRKVTTVHDLILLKAENPDKNQLVFKTKQFIGRGVFWLIGRTSRHIIVPTNYTRDDYRQFARIKLDKVTVTYEGADVGAVQPAPIRQMIGKKFIMYVGNQNEYKNIQRLMQAHQILRQSHPDLLLLLVGKLKGPNGVSLRRNRQWARDKGLRGIIYTDFVSDEQLAWLYKNSSAYIFPSLMEGFGLPGLEAMGCGAPVVSSNTTCLPEVYGDAAHYFNPLSVHEMAHSINEVLISQKLRSRLIKAGHEQVKRYSWHRMAEQTLAIYHRSVS